MKLLNEEFIFGSSLVLLSISFTQKAFYLDSGPEEGWFCFFAGWIGFFNENFFATFIWLANPLYFISIVLLLKRKPLAFEISILALLLGICFLFIKSIALSDSGQLEQIKSLGLSYMLWLFNLIFTTALIGLMNKRKKGSWWS